MHEIDLVVDDLDLETMPEGNALNCVASGSSASTASCPGSTAATLATASTLG